MAAANSSSSQTTPWLKRVLIPFWVIQLALMAFILVVFISIIVADNGSVAIYQLLIFILVLITILLSLTEIILYWRKRLQPLTYLVLQCVKAAVWGMLFLWVLVMGIVVQQKQEQDKVNTSLTIGTGVFGGVFFVFLGSLIYGGVIFHRHRRSKRRAMLAGNGFGQPSYYRGSGTQYQPLGSLYANTVTAIEGGDVAGSTVAESEGLVSPAVEPKSKRTRRSELAGDAEVFELAGGRHVKGEGPDGWK